MDAKQASRATKASRTRRGNAKSKQLKEERGKFSAERKRGRKAARRHVLPEARDAIFDAIEGGMCSTTVHLGRGVWAGKATALRMAYWEGALERVVEILQREGYMVDGRVKLDHYDSRGSDPMFFESFDFIDPKVVIEWERG